MRNYRKVLAGTLAATMVLGSSFAAFAADEQGTTSGTGGLDIVEKSDIFQVVLPTEGGSEFNYILDPKGVIKETNADKYSNATFADGKTVYFANAAQSTASGAATRSGGAGGNVSYSDVSDKLTVTNKSTMDVDIKVTASVAEHAKITMATSSSFAADDKTASLYLALRDDDANNTDVAITTDGAELTSKIPALANAYETKYVNGKYVKQLKADATGFKEYSFQLTGACNPNGEWTGLTDAPPTVDVVWSVKDPTAAPANAAPSFNNGQPITYDASSGQNLTVPFSMGRGDLAAEEITDIIFDWGGGTYTSVNGTWGDTPNGSITLGEDSFTVVYTGMLEYCTAGTFNVYVILDGDHENYVTLPINCE